MYRLFKSCILVSVLWSTFRASTAGTCPHSCAAPEGLNFCSVVSFRTCMLGDSWYEQDHAAETYYRSLVTNDSPQACNSTLQKFACYKAFPACELGKEYKGLCHSSCDDVRAKCPDAFVPEECRVSKRKLGYQTISGSTQSSSFLATRLMLEQNMILVQNLSTSDNCFALSYSGPSYSLWIAGFLINFIFSFLAALGINMQKHSLGLAHNANVPPVKQRIWLMGMCLISAGSALDFLAFGLAPMTLLAPLAALTLVWNMLLAPRFHGETVTRRNAIATATIIFGVVVTVIFSSHSTPTYSLDDLLLLYSRPAMAVYLTVVASLLGAMYATTRIIEKRPILQGGLLHILCYGGLGGTFGGQSVLFAKCTVELLKSAITNPSVGGEAFAHWQPYAIILAMAFCLFCQVSFLNAGLRRFDALLTVPVYQSFWIVSSVCAGLVYFQEWVYMNTVETIFFVLGVSITVGGIAYLLRARSTDRQKMTDQNRLKSARCGSSGVEYSELGFGIDDSDLEDGCLPDTLGSSESELLGFKKGQGRVDETAKNELSVNPDLRTPTKQKGLFGRFRWGNLAGHTLSRFRRFRSGGSSKCSSSELAQLNKSDRHDTWSTGTIDLDFSDEMHAISSDLAENRSNVNSQNHHINRDSTINVDLESVHGSLDDDHELEDSGDIGVGNGASDYDLSSWYRNPHKFATDDFADIAAETYARTRRASNVS